MRWVLANFPYSTADSLPIYNSRLGQAENFQSQFFSQKSHVTLIKCKFKFIEISCLFGVSISFNIIN